MGHPQKGPLWDQNRQPHVKKKTVLAYSGSGRGGGPKMVLILHCAILNFGTHASPLQMVWLRVSTGRAPQDSYVGHLGPGLMYQGPVPT
jgi:hypothetical protein